MRVSYEGNQAVYIIEGLPRTSYYFTEPNIYDGSQNTISTIVSKNLTKKKELGLEKTVLMNILRD